MLRLPLACLLLFASTTCAGPEDVHSDEVRVHVERVALDEHQIPVVVLEEEGGHRWLPIWIGAAEAHSIALQIGEHPSVRPNTHDLTRRVIQELEGELERVVVTDLQRGTYFATLTLRSRGRLIEIDSRPSDAIAIALRAGAPIFVREWLLDNASEGEEGPTDEGDGSGREV